MDLRTVLGDIYLEEIREFHSVLVNLWLCFEETTDKSWHSKESPMQSQPLRHHLIYGDT